MRRSRSIRRPWAPAGRQRCSRRAAAWNDPVMLLAKELLMFTGQGGRLRLAWSLRLEVNLR